MNYEFELVDVFTERPFSGNQLAVLPDARGLTAAQMQAIAREFNFAESAFVLPPITSGSTARLRIFAPGEEMPFAGHPTVGSAAVLARRGASGASGSSADILFDEAIGKVKVTVDWRGGHACAELCLEPTLERPDGVPSTERLAAALTLPSGDVVDAWFAGVGLPFAYCRLVSARAVDEAVLDRAAFAAALGGTWARNLFLFAGEPVDGATLHGRMFAPGIGVEEDPATGSACAALAGWIASGDPRPDVTLSITVQQGVAMGRPSLLRGGATKVGGNLRSITVGGNVLFVGGGHLDVPAAS